MVIRHWPCHHDWLPIKPSGYMPYVPIVKTTCMMLDLFHWLLALSQRLLLHLRSHHHEHFFHHTLVSAGLFLLSLWALNICTLFWETGESSHSCIVVMVALGRKIKANYVSFNLPVDVCHPYSFDVTQLFGQMDFKILGHVMCWFSATTGKTDGWNNQ